MKISVILCTYNRCESLAKALESIAALSLREPADWEVLVVDNNSNDRTREIAEGYCNRFPQRFRYIFEPRQGLSAARNAGIREARGAIVAFTDDDVTVHPMWLENLAAPLRDGTWMGSGGRILPEKEFKLPKWLSTDGPYALAPLAIFDTGPDARELVEPPFGANMAFRKTMFEKYGEFRTDLGRCGGNMMSNEDTEYGKRLLVGGERIHYEPSAVVYHSISPDRVRKEYFLAWWLGKGRAEFRESRIEPGTRWRIAGVPFYLIRRLAKWILRWVFTFESASRFTCKLKVWWLMGLILESRAEHARPVPAMEMNKATTPDLTLGRRTNP
jgi:glycosyltransferase involved in cell wall biosynthesis